MALTPTRDALEAMAPVKAEQLKVKAKAVAGETTAELAKTAVSE